MGKEYIGEFIETNKKETPNCKMQTALLVFNQEAVCWEVNWECIEEFDYQCVGKFTCKFFYFLFSKIIFLNRFFQSNDLCSINQFVYLEDDIINMEKVFDFELLSIACKYEIEPLKSLCTDQLVQQVRMENVVDYWEQFNNFNREKGKDECEDFMKQNWDRILRSDTYDALLSNDPETAIKLTLSTFGNWYIV